MATPRELWLAVLSVVLVTSGFGFPSGARAEADGQFSERKSAHFRLYQGVGIEKYSGPHGWRQFELQLLDILERAYDRVGKLLGIWPSHDVRVAVYDPGVFDAKYQRHFGFRAVGFFDGAIHVRGAKQVDAGLAGTLHHEYTHAAIQAEVGPGLFPAWLNEGLAEYVEARASGRRLGPGQYRVLAEASRQGTWLPLESLAAPSFAHLPGDSASLAYLESHAMVEYLARRHGEEKLRWLCEELGRTRNLERALDRTYHRSLAELESELRAAL